MCKQKFAHANPTPAVPTFSSSYFFTYEWLDSNHDGWISNIYAAPYTVGVNFKFDELSIFGCCNFLFRSYCSSTDDLYIYISTDYGEVWPKYSYEIIPNYLAMTTSAAAQVASTSSSSNLPFIYPTDNGTSWKRVGPSPIGNCLGIVVHNTGAIFVFKAGGFNLYLSTNHGKDCCRLSIVSIFAYFSQ
jgi:hypothetical protein